MTQQGERAALLSAATSPDHPRHWALALWAAIFIGVPMIAASLGGPGAAPPPRPAHPFTIGQQSAPPPPVEPMEILKIAPMEARALNAAVPFSRAPNPAARPFTFTGSVDDLARATDCLAAAQLYEAGDDPSGQQAVAQVVINRMRHPAFPKTVCGVVFQGAERRTGCQFTFTCDGALARVPAPAVWERARTLAARMLSGKVDGRVGYATHYHTDWVVPYWSSSLDKITSVDTHLFFRWKGWWGTPPAFRGRTGGSEPAIASLAFLSPAHARASAALRGPDFASADGRQTMPTFPDLGRPALTIGRDRIGERFGPGRLAAINSAGDAFVILLDPRARPETFEPLALEICGGRTRCRLLGWTRASDAPNAFPIDEATLASMSYAYMRITDSGLERSLYNCAQFPGQAENRCMRRRATAPPPLPAPVEKSGTETIRLIH